MTTPNLDLNALNENVLGIAAGVSLASTLVLATFHAYRIQPKPTPRGRRAKPPATPSAISHTVRLTGITIGAITTGILLALIAVAWMV